MAVDITLLRAYTDGAVYTHAVGASPTAPTDASTALNVGFVECGAVSDAGVAETTSQERKDFYLWQGNTLARRIPGKFVKSFKFAAAETKVFNLGIQYPGSAIATTGEGASVAEKAPATDIRRWVLNGRDGASRQLRLYLPFGEVTDRGDVLWSSEEVTVYEWTLTAYPDTSGVVDYRYYVGIS